MYDFFNTLISGSNKIGNQMASSSGWQSGWFQLFSILGMVEGTLLVNITSLVIAYIVCETDVSRNVIENKSYLPLLGFVNGIFNEQACKIDIKFSHDLTFYIHV